MSAVTLHISIVPEEIINIILSYLDCVSRVRLHCCQNTIKLFRLTPEQLMNLRMQHLSGHDFNYSDLKYFSIIEKPGFFNPISFNSPLKCNNYTYLNNFNHNELNIEIDKLHEGELGRLYKELISLVGNSDDNHIFNIIQRSLSETLATSSASALLY